MQKKKLKLDEIKVESFITSLMNSENIQGGTTEPSNCQCTTQGPCATNPCGTAECGSDSAPCTGPYNC